MPKTQPKTTDNINITCNVKPALLEQLNKRAEIEDLNRSQVMKRAFDFYLKTPIDA